MRLLVKSFQTILLTLTKWLHLPLAADVVSPIVDKED